MGFKEAFVIQRTSSYYMCAFNVQNTYRHGAVYDRKNESQVGAMAEMLGACSCVLRTWMTDWHRETEMCKLCI